MNVDMAVFISIEMFEVDRYLLYIFSWPAMPC